MEHRFAYPSAPWAGGRGCVTPDDVRYLQSEFPSLQLIPFVNLLGHFEGMLYTEYGKRFAEERFQGMQACPSNPEFVKLCLALVDDVISIFQSDIIHIGGDETAQLARCDRCKGDSSDPNRKAQIYGDHFGPLAERVTAAGRVPAVWGDMFLEHPSALELLPKSTIIFDWQYFSSPMASSAKFIQAGHPVVCCPTIQTYNSSWMNLLQSELNIRQAVEAAEELGASGVCVTTWECALFGNYETLFPALESSGKILTSGEGSSVSEVEADDSLLLKGYLAGGDELARWAKLMGVDLLQLGGPFSYSQTRSSLKARLLLYSNPFLAWLYHGEELSGSIGDAALEILEEAIAIAPNSAYRGISEFVKLAIDFIRYAEQARQAYANELPGVATSTLAPCRQIFTNLEKIAYATHKRIGGSLADVERCRRAKLHIETVIKRIKEYGDGSLGYLPAFEIISHPKFMPHDQACWWLINKWANE
jgi:hypothetical protein